MAPKRPQRKTPMLSSNARRLLMLFSFPIMAAVAVLLVAPWLPSMRQLACRWAAMTRSGESAAWLQQYESHEMKPPLVGSEEYNRTMYWGTYRPNVLMGVKARAHTSLLFGLAWVDARHRSERHATSEDLAFRWVVHDGRHIGKQVIEDPVFGISLTIVFLKAPQGDAWNVHITGDHVLDVSVGRQLVVYFASEDLSDHGALVAANGVQLADELQGAEARLRLRELGPESSVVENVMNAATRDDVIVRGGVRLFDGQHGEFAAQLSDFSGESSTWDLRGWNAGNKVQPRPLPHHVPLISSAGSFDLNAPRSRLTKLIHTVVAKRRIGRRIDVRISFASRPILPLRVVEQDASAPLASAKDFHFIPFCLGSVLAVELEAAFHRRFDATFGVRRAPKLPPSLTSSSLLDEMGEMVLSNMIGGMGYWSGKYITIDPELDARADRDGAQIDPHRALRYARESPHEVQLFSGVPSRSKFPRGFLWDEGFHQLLMSKWDAEISKDVISHWLLNAKVTETGWIPREQIIGPEARERVPPEFVPQHPTHANPPSMVLAVQDFAFEAAQAQGEHAHDNFLIRIRPHLRQWQRWFRVTQCGGPPNCSDVWRRGSSSSGGSGSGSGSSVELDPFSFRWRSRHKFHLLASGLDDYARPVAVNRHTHEQHLDLFCWVALMASTMRSIDELMVKAGHSISDLEDKFDADEWERALVERHWDESRERFSDVTGRLGRDQHFSEFFGYVNLFPLLTMVIQDESKARLLIRHARDELMTGYGLASMSAASRKLLATTRFPHENYWTGPIWMNLNFMFLRALKLKYNALLGAEAEMLYDQLRADIIGNVAKVYAETRKVFENYHPITGAGQGTAPFTGWTSLVLLIASERY